MVGNAVPVILIASVSSDEGRHLARALNPTGWNVLAVNDAADAARRLDGTASRSVLLIDAGLLQMAHDAQWRAFRAEYPELGTVVRCFDAGRGVPWVEGGRTFHVGPDDLEGMRQAIRALSRPELPADHPAPSRSRIE